MSNAAVSATQDHGRSDGPLHVAIIMDGNGRWAAARGLTRAEGHRRGVEALRRVVRAAHELGILYLTIFSFSSENWSRPASEIGDLFGLLRRFIRNDLATLHRDGVRVRIIGERAGLEPDICALLSEAEELTRENARMNLIVAFNYGSRQEIARAASRLAREVAEGKRDPASIDADTLGQYLDVSDIPDPDLIILGNLVVLFELLDGIEAVAPYVADRHSRRFGIFVCNLYQLLAALLIEFRDPQTKHLSFRGRRQAEVGVDNGLLHGLDHRLVPDLHRVQPRLRYADGRKLV